MLQVLYEDNHCLAVCKPAGLLTQGVPAGIDTLEAQARAYLKEKYHKPGNVYLGIPHLVDSVYYDASGTRWIRLRNPHGPAGSAAAYIELTARQLWDNINIVEWANV